MKRLAYWSFYRLWKSLASIDVPVDSGDFCLMDRKVVDILNSLPEKQRFVRGLRSWVGFKQVPIPYERNARQHGKVKYSLPMLMGLAADGIFSFSRRPLTAIAKIGFIVSCVSLSSILVVLYIRLFTNLSLPGFASIASILLFLGGVQLFAIGIVGEYIARIFDEVKDRPTFLVATTVNIEEAEGEGI
jgi:dolichol-phosphate mannosyltransferase